MDEVVIPSVTLKVVGHQWYWSYDWTFQNETFPEFDSFMLSESELLSLNFPFHYYPRLLETDNILVFPLNQVVRIIVTADDVLHSWAVPALGLKIDCVPGRLNQVHVKPIRIGFYYGQCSELCGVNHGQMPIQVAVDPMLISFEDD